LVQKSGLGQGIEKFLQAYRQGGGGEGRRPELAVTGGRVKKTRTLKKKTKIRGKGLKWGRHEGWGEK